MSTFNDMVGFLELAWPARSQIIPCLIGPPGIGKTSAVEEFARRLSERDGQQHKVVKLILSRCVPSETVGMTMPNSDEHTMDIYNSRLMMSLKDGDIWLLDEFYESSAFVQSVMLTVLESREMADGTPLPDVMIVAASNPVVTPQSIKLSVRDRFLTREFRIDAESTINHIKNRFDLDCSAMKGSLKSEGPTWNVLTPRTLTKLAEWVQTTEDSLRARAICDQIDTAFDAMYGKFLFEAWCRTHADPLPTPEEQMRKKLIELFEAGVISSYDMAKYERSFNHSSTEIFQNVSIPELMEVLTTLPNWEDVKTALEKTAVVEDTPSMPPF